MRKLLVSTLAVVGFATVASAQVDSVLFLDIRDGTSANQSLSAPVFPYTNGQEKVPAQTAQNGGGAGDGQVLRMSPVHTTGGNEVTNGWPNNDVDGNSSTGKLWLYMLVNDDASGTGDVISSVGVDFNRTDPATPRNTINTFSYAWDVAIGWNGTAPGAANGGDWDGAKAVKVPVSGTPAVYDTTGGLVPSATAYRIGALSFTAGVRNCTTGGTTHAANSTYLFHMSVNNLLVTRTFETGGDAVENVALGYAVGTGAGGPGPDATVNGSTPNATTAIPDGAVIVASKGDFNGSGTVTNVDVGGANGFNQAIADSVGGNIHKQSQAFYGDFSGDRRVTNIDVAGFNAALGSSLSCP
jgi:hypothetical protein